MPTYRQQLNNRDIIRAKKRVKLERLQAENTAEVGGDTTEERAEEEGDDTTEESTVKEEVCKRCGQPGHKDARSRLCRMNKNYDPQKAALFDTSRKRKRRDDTGEGPSTKRRQTTTGSSSTGATRATGSTTRSIRSGIKGVLSLERKEANRRARAAGRAIKQKAIRNPNFKRCPNCVKNDCYDDQKPHSSTRSKLCPNHKQNIDEYIVEKVGRNYRRLTRKHSLDSLILLGEREKASFLRNITELVDDYRRIAIKMQLFASYYIRYCLQNNVYLPPIIFSQDFFYACIKKVMGDEISNKNPNVPKDHIDGVYEIYRRQFPLFPSRRIHSDAFATLALNSATNLGLHVSENYMKRLRSYIKIRLLEVLNLSADQINALTDYVYTRTVNPTTEVAWPRAVPETRDNWNFSNTIIHDCQLPNHLVNIAAITADPGVYLRHMYVMLAYLEAYNNDIIRTFNEVQVEATYVWVKQVIRGTDLFNPLNRKKRNRLSFLIYRCLRTNNDFRNTPNLDDAQLLFVRNLLQTTREQIRNSRIYLNTDHPDQPNIRPQDCFRPEMALSIKQYKLFNLVPMYSLTRKYVTIGHELFKSLLVAVRRETGTRLAALQEVDNPNRHEQRTAMFGQVFDFRKLRINVDDTGSEVFTNMVRTDGYGIDFIMAARRNHDGDLPDLDLDDFTEEELERDFHLWGVDPGMINIFTASDGHGHEPHEVRRYTTAEYYTRAGFKKTNKEILQFKTANQDLIQAETAILTSKTASLDTFALYVHSLLDNIITLLHFYDNRFTERRFLNYIGRQRADAEMVNIFVNGGKKYLKREVKQTGRDDKRKPPKRRKRRITTLRRRKGKEKEKTEKHRLKPFEQDDRIPLIALGDAVFPVTMKGTLPGLARRLLKRLKRAEYEGLLVTVPVTEYRTSRV